MTEQSSINEFVDATGNIRRCGTIPKPAGFVSAFPTFESQFNVWSDQQIQTALTMPGRRVARKILGDEWIPNQGPYGSCFPAGTLIRMANGSQKPIESIKLLDEVLTAEGNVRRVMKVMVRPHVGTINRVCAWGLRHLRATDEHPILTKRGYVPVDQLQKNDWIAIPRFMPQTTESIVPVEYVHQNTKSMTRKTFAHTAMEYTCRIPGKAEAVVKRTPLPELIVLNAAFGRLCGLYLAEGSISQGKITYTFNENEHDTLVTEVVNLWESEFGVKANICSGRGAKRVCEVKVYGVGWCHLFENLFGSGSSVKSLHPDIASGPREFLEAMLAGWQAGDGLGDPDRCGGVTVSHSLAMNMYDIANAVGHNPTIESLQVAINPKHKIKHRHMRYIVAWPSSGVPHPTQKRMQQDESVVWRTIHKIDKEPFSGFVYNLEVEGDHSYVAEGVGVHNCNGWAAANAFSRAKYLSDLADDTKYSGDWIYSLINGGRDNGSMLEDGLRVAQEVGFVSTADCPLGQIYPSKQKPGLKDLAARNKAVDCYAVETMQGLRTAGAAGFMLIVAVHVGSNWQRLDSRGISGVDRGQGNHAVCVDDMLILPGGPEVFDCIMDWGTQVGTRGKSYLTAQHFAQTFSSHVFYAIPTGQRGLGV